MLVYTFENLLQRPSNGRAISASRDQQMNKQMSSIQYNRVTDPEYDEVCSIASYCDKNRRVGSTHVECSTIESRLLTITVTQFDIYYCKFVHRCNVA